MSDTITGSDSMTAAELLTELSKLQREIGRRAHVSACLIADTTNSATPAYISVNPGGICARDGDAQTFQSATWSESFAAARAWLAARGPIRHNAIVRKMALAIIELTDEHGRCTEAMLRGRDFTAAEIAEFRDAACARAGEMAGNAPFEVVA